ncbi:calcium-binding protein [Rhizobium alarense]|uniref:calcium-binding protein n=1 Tax=Rhizobium alarense TaxID=2846851 RepID=UPI001F439039|nr:calcium-binding protein [Rhizobium alarense]
MTLAKMFYWLDAEYISSTSNLNFSLRSKSDNKISYKVEDDSGAIKGLVLKGDDIVVNNNRITSGNIDEVIFLAGGKRKILEVEALDLGGKEIQTAIAAETTWKLLTLIFNGNDKISVRGDEVDVFTGAGNDVVRLTASGYKLIYDGPGSDTYIGSSGNRADTGLSYEDADLYTGFGKYQGVKVDLARQRAVDPWGDVDTLKNIGFVFGSDRGDVIKGASNWESFCGMAGNDLIDGRGGGDRVDYKPELRDGGRHGVTVNLAKGTALDSFGDKDTLRNIEDVRGSRFNDRIIGDDTGNMLEGAEGQDVLTGKGGADQFRFRDGFGRDTITDFKIGVDTIGLNELAGLFDGFDGLDITQSGENTVIRFDDLPRQKITLLDVQADDLTASDFLL